jgi:hypothetical protein
LKALRPRIARLAMKMTLCPIAIAVGCKKCPAFNICPLKSVIGDYKRQDEPQMPSGVDKTNGDK